MCKPFISPTQYDSYSKRRLLLRSTLESQSFWQSQRDFHKVLPELNLCLIRFMKVFVRQEKTHIWYKLKTHHGQSCCQREQHSQCDFHKVLPELNLCLIRFMKVFVCQEKTHLWYKLKIHHGQSCCHREQSYKRTKRNSCCLEKNSPVKGQNGNSTRQTYYVLSAYVTHGYATT